jgi:DNA-binding transcriptional ArsR family regulator
MKLSPVKRLVLETMWVLDKPAKAVEIAEEVGLGFPSVMMHIIGLTRMGYVMTPEKGRYIITENGKSAFGFPEINGEKAQQILEYLPAEKSFHFYADVGKPLNVFAANLQDFCDKILKVDVSSIEFHTDRGDFEAWFTAIGDIELGRKTLLIKERKATGEELRNRLYEAVNHRCEELLKLRQAAVSSDQTRI